MTDYTEANPQIHKNHTAQKNEFYSRMLIGGGPLWLWGCVVSVFIVTLILNDGFMAFDEYFIGVVRYIPAQTSDIAHLVGPDDVKSPLQLLPMHFLAQTALALGILKPYLQYRFVLSVLGFFNFILLAFALKGYGRSVWNQTEKTISLLLLGFYFVAPFALTRLMFESLAAPWIALTVYWGHLYEMQERRRDLLLSVLCASMAFILRQQVGACALACLGLPLLKRKTSDFWIAAGLGLICFIAAGVPDYFLRGSFHFSLWAILTYNIHHGAEYATHPLSTYPLLIFGLCFGPWWIMKFPKGFWREHWQKNRMAWWVLILFVVSHSCFPQKWERFVISMIPVMLILMVPLFKNLWEERRVRGWRFRSLVIFNMMLWVPATFFPPQKNLIDLSLFLDAHPEIKTVYRVDHIPEWITEVFIEKKNFQFKELTRDDLRLLASPHDCTEILVVPHFLAEQVKNEKWQFIEEIKVNFLEALAYKTNPKTNVRRTNLLIYGCLGFQRVR